MSTSLEDVTVRIPIHQMANSISADPRVQPSVSESVTGSHQVEPTEGNQGTETEKHHDLDSVRLDRRVHCPEDAVALRTTLRLVVQHIPEHFVQERHHPSSLRLSYNCLEETFRHVPTLKNCTPQASYLAMVA